MLENPGQLCSNDASMQPIFPAEENPSPKETNLEGENPYGEVISRLQMMDFPAANSRATAGMMCSEFDGTNKCC